MYDVYRTGTYVAYARGNDRRQGLCKPCQYGDMCDRLSYFPFFKERLDDEQTTAAVIHIQKAVTSAAPVY